MDTTCNLCYGKLFSSKINRDFHIIGTHNVVPCDLCNYFFANVLQYKEHLMDCHTMHCPICNAKLISGQFRAHVEFSHSFKCSHCEQVFETDELREEHRRKCLQKVSKGEVKCDVCSQYCLNIQEYKNHFRITHGTSCSICNLIMLDTEQIEQHMQLNHTNNYNFMTSRVSCDKCSLNFANVLEYNRHFREKHTGTCHICGTTLFDEEQTAQHWQLAHILKCYKCPKKFPTLMQRDEHYRSCHEIKRSDRVQCESCNKSFRNVIKYKKHFQTQHPITCPICKIRLIDIPNRQRHMVVAHKYECAQCLKVFQTEVQRNIHHTSAHPIKHICVVCGISFTSETDRYEHYKLEHALKKCALCDEMFHNYVALEAHYKMIHCNFKCSLCDEAVLTQELLDNHVKAIHELKCELCEKVYTTAVLLQYHYSYGHIKIKTENVHIKKEETFSDSEDEAVPESSLK